MGLLSQLTGDSKASKPVPVTSSPQPALPASTPRDATGKSAPVYEADVKIPDLSAGDPRAVWDQFFSQHRPAPHLVSGWVMKLHADKQYKQVIACLQSALIHGQAQPWMYEVLALTMELEGAPKADVERVMLSLTDFGGADYETMMFSGAYLTRFHRTATALTLYQQASRLLPERSEPYVLGLKLAQDLKQPDAIEWAAAGVLMHSWGPDYQKQHRDAENALRELARQCRLKNDEVAATRFEETLKSARSLDLSIRLDWNGAADLDLRIEEPLGGICSVESPQTATGGLFLHDGVGPDAKNSYEFYVCPRGIAGPYRITVRNVGGTLVGDRATLTVTMLEGTKDQSRIVRTLVLDKGGEAGLTVDLPLGRRTQPRTVTSRLTGDVPAATASRRGAPDRSAVQARSQAAAAALEAWEQEQQQTGRRVPRAGAMGYAPVIGVVGSGTTLPVQAAVSADRRYVKIGLQPQLNELVEVFTFTYQNAGTGQGGR